VKRKRYPRKFQRMAVERMRTCEDVGELAKELGVTRRCLYKWRAKLDLADSGFARIFLAARREHSATCCCRRSLAWRITSSLDWDIVTHLWKVGIAT